MAHQQILSAYSAIKTRFNFNFDLKDKQISCLSSIVAKKNVFSVLPTGFGKSASFLLPPLILDEVSSSQFIVDNFELLKWSV